MSRTSTPRDPYLPLAKSSAQAAAKKPASHRPETLYFAYGSNLHLKQMGRRCPRSRYIGRAVLKDYRWQINQRGYANVVESAGQKVEGLVYLLSEVDEAALDRAEGVPSCYEKKMLPVKLYAGGIKVVGRSVLELVETGVLQSVHASSSNPFDPHKKSETVEVLVYIDSKRTRDDAPRQEYIQRIKSGIADAVVLGMSTEYCTAVMLPGLLFEVDHMVED